MLFAAVILAQVGLGVLLYVVVMLLTGQAWLSWWFRADRRRHSAAFWVSVAATASLGVFLLKTAIDLAK